MPIKSSRTVASIASILLVIVGFVVVCNIKYEIPKPENWSANVKLYRRGLGGETSVFDADSGKLLFSYRPENVHPISIEKLDSNHWRVVFEDPTKR
jgi:hypothetical protein